MVQNKFWTQPIFHYHYALPFSLPSKIKITLSFIRLDYQKSKKKFKIHEICYYSATVSLCESVRMLQLSLNRNTSKYSALYSRNRNGIMTSGILLTRMMRNLFEAFCLFDLHQQTRQNWFTFYIYKLFIPKVY